MSNGGVCLAGANSEPTVEGSGGIQLQYSYFKNGRLTKGEIYVDVVVQNYDEIQIGNLAIYYSSDK